MANLNEAFNLNYSGKNYRLPQENNNRVVEEELSNTINNPFMTYQNAFNRVKVSNQKYDNITRSTNKPIYGYECQICQRSVGIHMALQDRYPHEFIRGKFRPLSEEEL